MSGQEDENLVTARLTMRALARFGLESGERPGVASEAEGNTGLLAVISELASDFLEHGIFSERTRYAATSGGKPNWARTVSRETAFIDSGGSVVYPNIRTSRYRDSSDSLLARVQAKVLIEIAGQHGWWLDGLEGREHELKRYQAPSLPRQLWSTHLRLMLPELYAARSIRLANSLIAYLEDSRDRRSGENYFGVNDFHTVWEHMLRRSLAGVEEGWNNRLPRPAYYRPGGTYEVQARGLQTDIVLRDGEHLTIVDAKYYDATFVGNSPELSDIVKQMFYEFAFRSVGDEELSGCFVFPSSTDGDGPFSEIRFRHRDDREEEFFPKIECFYVSISRVMKAYTERRKIGLS